MLVTVLDYTNGWVIHLHNPPLHSKAANPNVAFENLDEDFEDQLFNYLNNDLELNLNIDQCHWMCVENDNKETIKHYNG